MGALVGCGSEPVPTVKYEARTVDTTVDTTDAIEVDSSEYFVDTDNTIVEELNEYIEVKIGDNIEIDSDSLHMKHNRIPERIELLLNKQGILEQIIFDRKAVEKHVFQTSTELLLNPKRVRVLGKKVTMTYISRYYGVSLAKIREYNPGIDIDKIRVNQVINLECNCGNPNK